MEGAARCPPAPAPTGWESRAQGTRSTARASPKSSGVAVGARRCREAPGWMVASCRSPGEARSAGEDGTAGGCRGAGAEAEREDLLAWSCCPSPACISACRSWQDLRFWEHAASPRPFSSCVCQGRRWATLRDQARGSGGKESSGELRDGVGCAMGIIPCSFRAAQDFFLAVSPSRSCPRCSGERAALPGSLGSPSPKLFGGGFPSLPEEMEGKRRWPGFLGIPRILPESLVPLFGLGWGRCLMWVGGCSRWQEPEGSGLCQSSPSVAWGCGPSAEKLVKKSKKKKKKKLFTPFRCACIGMTGTIHQGGTGTAARDGDALRWGCEQLFGKPQPLRCLPVA